jgi:RNA binding exosome subunit
MKENKYTLKEIEELFNNAEVETLEDLDNSMREVMKEKGHEDNGIHMFSYSLQNMMAITTVRKKLFEKMKGNVENERE